VSRRFGCTGATKGPLLVGTGRPKPLREIATSPRNAAGRSSGVLAFSVFIPVRSMPRRRAAAMLCRASMTRCSAQ
jgi:hypothetical protein